jgi:hypothetical protein
MKFLPVRLATDGDRCSPALRHPSTERQLRQGTPVTMAVGTDPCDRIRRRLKEVGSLICYLLMPGVTDIATASVYTT